MPHLLSYIVLALTPTLVIPVRCHLSFRVDEVAGLPLFTFSKSPLNYPVHTDQVLITANCSEYELLTARMQLV